MSIDWTDPNDKVSKYFTVKECIWLPKWLRLADDKELTEEVKANLIKLCYIMDDIRDFIGKPLRSHVAFRPEEYNKLVGGAKNSMHKFGRAMDFSVSGMLCDDVRKLLEPKLIDFNIRMENLPMSNWVHIDTGQPNPNRYFIP